MENKSKFSFYNFRYNSDLGIPIVVITCSANSTFNKYTSEYYIFFPQKDEFFGCQISSKEYENIYIKIDFDFMFREALVFAQEKIDNHLFEINKGNKNTHYLLYDTKLKESNPISFVNLIKSNKYHKEITSIRNQTKCKDLINFIDGIIDSDIEFDFNIKDFIVE